MKATMHLILAKLGLISVGEVARKTVSFGDPEASKGGLFWSIVSIVLIFALWSLAVALEWASPIFLPGPGAVLSQFWAVATDGFRGATLWEHLGISLYRPRPRLCARLPDWHSHRLCHGALQGLPRLF